MKKEFSIRGRFLILFFLALIPLSFFFRIYVPLAKSFQMVLAPILLITFVIAAIRISWGILVFAFAFPLINNLPYFFGLDDNVPHAPASLILFLVFGLGWLLHTALHPSPQRLDRSIRIPLVIFAFLVLISGLVTFLRYADFFPFRTAEIRELLVNVNGVRAGGAFMSIVFHSLSYLTGFLFFLIVANSLKSWEFVKKILAVMSVSFGLSLLFALVQRYHSISLGNTPFWVSVGRINGTFTDPNAFGAFLAAFLPLMIGLALSSGRRTRTFLLAGVLLALFVFPAIGSRSALIGLAVSGLAVFVLLWAKGAPQFRKASRWVLAAFLVILVVFLTLAFFSSSLNLYQRIQKDIDLIGRKDSLGELFGRRLEFWGVASFMIGDYPLTGVGVGAFIIELPNYAAALEMPFRYTDSAQNYLFQAGAELGFPGVLLLLWIFFVIFRRAFVSWQGVKALQPQTYILLGILAGCLSICVNLIFHTYIGSFEIHYLLWFLLAAVFMFPGERKDEEGRSRLSPLLRLTIIAVLVLFGLGHLWNSSHSLSLERRTRTFGWDQNFGLYKREKDNRRFYFRWMRESAGITVEKAGKTLVLPLLASHPDIQERPVTVRISSSDALFREKTLLQEIVLREKIWTDVECDVSGLRGDKLHLRFETDRTWEPRKYSAVPDPRRLAVGLGEAWFKFPEDLPVERIAAGHRIPGQDWQGQQKQNLARDGTSLLPFRTENNKDALRLWVKGTPALGIGPYLVLKIDDRIIGRTMLLRKGWTSLVFEPFLVPGDHILSVQFINDFHWIQTKEDRNVYLGDLEIISLK